VNNAPAPVSRFAAMKPRQRPTALCPQCERPVILKLGPVRKHHAAHHPGEVCSATQPESALHISVKCHIADELRRAGSARIPLIVVERCAVGRSVLVATSETLSPHELSSSPCDATQEHLAALTWDDVVVERRIAGHDAEDSTLARTPDIVLLNASVPILAIEVFVTHRVDQIKAEALAVLECHGPRSALTLRQTSSPLGRVISLSQSRSGAVLGSGDAQSTSRNTMSG
jgi:hypothetical protein